MRFLVLAMAIVPLVGCSRSSEHSSELSTGVEDLRAEVVALRNAGVYEPPVFDFGSCTEFENELLRVLGMRAVDTAAPGPDASPLEKVMHNSLVELAKEVREAQGPLRDPNLLRRAVNDLDWSTLPTTPPRILAEIAGHQDRIRKIEEKRNAAPKDNPFNQLLYDTLLENHSQRVVRLEKLAVDLKK